MEQMIAHLKHVGVQIKTGELVTGFENKEGKISKVITDSSVYDADTVVLATGSWSRELAAKMQVSIPLMPGRGYSVTLENSQYHINYPAVLIEGRAALTPMDGNKIRFGGTMEITATNTPPRIERVEGLLAAVKRFYPDFEVPVPTIDKVWFGFRPCSADGLPYLGRTSKWKNVVMATGHSMLGLSLGAGTGKIVSEIVNEETLSMNIAAFNPNRFD
jgi:D-amino-acid dehydrogenase